MPRISVVIPLYNKGAYISRAIDSVLGQTEQDFEIIIVDDASTDNGVDIVRQYTDLRIQLIHKDTPGDGGHAARNAGIRKASASLIAFLDADDAWKPQFLETVLRLRNNYPDAGAYATAYEIIKPGGRRVMPNFKAVPKYPWEGIISNYFKSSLGDPLVWTSAIIIPKHIFNTVGYFPEGEKLGGDLDMWLRIAVKYKIAFSRNVCATYFTDASNRICNQKYALDEYRLVNTINIMIKQKIINKSDLEYIQEYRNKYILEAAKGNLLAGNISKARSLLKNCNTKYFLKKRAVFLIATLLPLGLINSLLDIKRKVF